MPVFKKLKAASKKSQADFWQKTQGCGGNFGCQEKTRCFVKKLKNPSKIQKFSIFLGIVQKSKQFLHSFPKQVKLWFYKLPPAGLPAGRKIQNDTILEKK